MYKLTLTCLLFFGITLAAKAQVNGGLYAFEYLRMSNSPYVSALGGIAPASPDRNVSLTLQNPALLRPIFHQQLSLNYNAFYGDIHIANVQYAHHHAKSKTDIGFGIQYLNYGSLDFNDIYGNTVGSFNANDFSLNISASRQYSAKWRYGATLKYAQSFLGDVSGSAILADFGIAYIDTVKKITIGAVAKNMGVAIKKYNPQHNAEALPFDLQLGITKQLENVPIRLFAVVHHLNRWNIRYDNPADKAKNIFNQNDTSDIDKKYFFDKLFRHLNFGAEIIFAKRLTFTAAYNHLRRKENGVENGQGAAGFSFGLSLELNKMQLRYGRAYYGSGGAYNEFGINIDINKFLNLQHKEVTTAGYWH